MNSRLLLVLLCALALPACSNFNAKPGSSGSGPYEMDSDAAPLPEQIPQDVVNTPDAVPKDEPKSTSGNASTYEVFGQTYEVRKSAENFRERGYASWYGRKFHGHKTASGERYDMFAMTAAHKTLPLPTYVRVTRVETGKSIVVKVNDRGPFHKGRIIDLSYAAAAKLGMLGHGEALVEIEAVKPGQEDDKRVVQAPPPQRGWLQIAAYTDPINAIALREELSNAGVAPIEIWSSGQEDEPLHRVVAGPFADEEAAQDTRQKILARGLSANWVNK